MSTRASTKHSIFGQPSNFSGSQLPTQAEVFRCFLWYRCQHDSQSAVKLSRREICKLVAVDLVNIWKSASIPAMMDHSIINKVERLIDSAENLQKYPDTKRISRTYQNDIEKFKTLFNICSCKCVSNGILNRDQCKCSAKVPQLEWEFWIDQHFDRKMFMGAVDLKTTSVLKRRKERHEKSEKRFVRQSQQREYARAAQASTFCRDSDDELLLESEALVVESDNDDIYQSSLTESSSDSETKAQNRFQYRNLSEMIERTGVSNRDACKLINAFLKDMCLDSEENLLEETKLRRQRQRWRQTNLKLHSESTRELCCIGFDGKIDETRVGQGKLRKTKREDHYVIVSFPDKSYVDHVAPQSQKAKDIASEILSILRDRLSTESLQAVVCDGTNVNTGENNGVIRLLEISLSRPLQWLICLLHLNELHLRAVFKHLDGETSGPSGFKGPIGKKLNFEPACLPIVHFKPVSGIIVNISDDVKSDLSQDQSYLLRASLAVQQGYENADPHEIEFLSLSSPGNLNQARWITCANRILRLFMSTDEPSAALVELVQYILTVYVPSWFQIKCHPYLIDGSRNFFFILNQSRQLQNKELTAVVQKTLKHNPFFSHPENVLVSALADSDISVRRFAAQKVINVRMSHREADSVRKVSRSLFSINFDANNYHDLVNWDDSVITSPPVLGNFSDDELLTMIEEGPLPVPKLPCHSQAVERTVKEVSRVSSKVYGHDSRHGMIVSTLRSKEITGSCDSKQSFLAQ